MPIIGWSESVPDGQDSLGQGDDVIKSLKTSLRIGLDGEHVWPSAGGDSGVHRLGSGRPYVGVQSLVSSTGTDGRLMFASDTSRFFHVGSGGTSFIGGPTAISAASYPGGAAPQRHYWAEEFGVGQTKSGTTVITYSSRYSGVPFIFLTANALEAESLWVNGPTDTIFAVRSTKTDNLGTSTTSFFWRSIGTRVL